MNGIEWFFFYNEKIKFVFREEVVMLLQSLIGTNRASCQANYLDSRQSPEVATFRQRQVQVIQDQSSVTGSDQSFTLLNRCAARGLVNIAAKPLQKSAQPRLKAAGYAAEITIKLVCKQLTNAINRINDTFFAES
ncbi:hypothetical protein [Kistimonas scapharcae]|uniref:hypothetical protein n=1 Tax=Kistimonas scapharcae TaxID=1036133 RepID=UPI0031F0212A